MARKRRHQEMSFGSGSFLDVLCNMVGILIILIAVVGMRVANKDEPVVDLPEVESPPAVVTVDPAIEERRLLNEQRRRENEERMAAHRQALAEHEAEAQRRQIEWQRLLEEMESLNSQLNANAREVKVRIETAAAAFEADEKRRMKLVEMAAAAVNQNTEIRSTEAELQKQALDLMERRKEIQAELEAQKVSQAIRKPVFEIVAHDGNSGTNRRPILIECRSDGLEFASEKVLVTAKVLNDYGPQNNPLLAGAEALTAYWKLADAKSGNPDSKPYVLLIVRPGGTIGFYVARKYLEALQQDYGYELVPDGAEIKWPAADPEAVEVCRTAVERAMKDPKSLARRMTGGTGGRGLGSSSGGGRTGIGKPGEEQIVGADGEFALPEVEELRRTNPKDSIGMLGPEWSPQRQRLTNSRPGTAGQAGGPETYNSGMGEGFDANRPRGVPSERPTNAGNLSERDDDRQAAHSGATGATGSGFNLKPYNAPMHPLANGATADANNVVPPAPDEESSTGARNGNAPTMSGMSSAGGGSQSGGRPNTLKPDMPASPLAERQSGLPRDGGRDRHWGKGTFNSGAIGIEREIILQLYPDRLAIVDGPATTLPEGLSREDFHQIVAAMIQVQANSWGDPPQKFVWRPRLKIEIYPGGNQHYGRLKELLTHWGLSSKIEHVLK